MGGAGSTLEASSNGCQAGLGGRALWLRGGWAGPLRGCICLRLWGCCPGLHLTDCKAAQSEWLRGRNTTRDLAEPSPSPHPALDRGLPEEVRSICPALDLDAGCSPSDR